MTDLLSTIDSLSTDQKFELLDALLESLEYLESDLAVPTEDQEAEMDRRMAQYEQNPAIAIPWEQVKANLLKNL